MKPIILLFLALTLNYASLARADKWASETSEQDTKTQAASSAVERCLTGNCDKFVQEGIASYDSHDKIREYVDNIQKHGTAAAPGTTAVPEDSRKDR